MFCIVSPTSDPYFNLAAEEYLFKNFGDDVFFQYINTPSVVVGKHQNAMAEINSVFVYENEIHVIRRISGGGAVYHDPGNLNFSFHKTVDDSGKVSFKDFSLPIVEALQKLGVPAEISNRNDIVVNGFKVSGHAQHVFRNRVMSHGTLLIDSDLEKLRNALRKSTGVYESKAIPSVRSEVANVSAFLPNPLATKDFRALLHQSIFQTIPGAKEYALNDSDLNCIQELIDIKYSLWSWNFGYSPAYQFTNELIFASGKFITCLLNVEKGIITDLELEGDALTRTEKEEIENGLHNQPHQPERIRNFFGKEIVLSVEPDPFFKLFF